MQRTDGTLSYVEENGFTLINCTHFEGDSNVAWRFIIVLSSHKDSFAKIIKKIEAFGSDIWIYQNILSSVWALWMSHSAPNSRRCSFGESLDRLLEYVRGHKGTGQRFGLDLGISKELFTQMWDVTWVGTREKTNKAGCWFSRGWSGAEFSQPNLSPSLSFN